MGDSYVKSATSFTNEEITPYLTLNTNTNNLSAKIHNFKVVDGKIKQASDCIKEIKYEMENGSLARRVSYGIAGTAAAVLLCPISWVAGIFFGFASAFGGGANNSTSDLAVYLFKAPVELCSYLFTKAIRSKEEWESNLNEASHAKTQLESDQLQLFNNIKQLNENNEKLIEKIKNYKLGDITKIGGSTIPQLLERAISIGQKISSLKSNNVAA